MAKKTLKEVSIRKHGHLFDFYVLKNGRIEYRIDKGKIYTVKELNDGKAYFIKKQEIVVKGELISIDHVELDEADFFALQEAQNSVLAEKEKSAKIEPKAQKEILSRVDSWKKRTRVQKDENKEKITYCIHDFRIGNDKYRFVERNIPTIGIVINPDYKISEDIPDVGGIPKQYGELMFWDYYFEDKGWQRVREMTYNEITCVDIIKKHGYNSSSQHVQEKTEKKKIFSFKK